MGCCSGVDNARRTYISPSSEPGLVNSTYVYVQGEFNYENFMASWNQRRTYAVCGDIYLKKIEPVPGKEDIQTANEPEINLEVETLGSKRIWKTEVYKNGKKVYEEKLKGKNSFLSFSWQDRDFLQKSSYVIHIEAGGGHLITSPINYSFLTGKNG